MKIETHDENQARDLFVRLQAGMPLNSQEKRDAWPGQFTDFVLRLGGKADIARYPGHDFFNDVMRGRRFRIAGRCDSWLLRLRCCFLQSARRTDCVISTLPLSTTFTTRISDSMRTRKTLTVSKRFSTGWGDAQRILAAVR